MSLDKFFNAKSVAVIGASRKSGTVGNSILANFKETFKGKIYPINPKAKKILGIPSFDSVTKIKGNIDLAVIAVPAKIVPLVLEECGEKKIPSAIIISSGFSEIGNTELEKTVQSVAKKQNIHLIGVNCLGIYDPYSKIDSLFLPSRKMGKPKKGNIAFISQSGAVGSVVLDWIASEGFGISKFVSYGNATDIDEADLIEYLGNDKDTKVICAYIEGTKDGKKLMRTAKKVSKKKPILVLKAGKTTAGSAAVSSHTGSMAGSDNVYDAAFRQSGMIRVSSVEEMFDFARVLSEQPVPKGNQILTVTNGGGFGVLATDSIIENGLRLAELSDNSKTKIKKTLPSYARVHNPLDLVGDADPHRYKIALDAIKRDKNVDAVLCITLFQTVSLEPKVVDYIIDFSKKSKKPIVVCSAGGPFVQKQRKGLEKAGIPSYETPARAAKALWCLTEYGNIKTQ